MTIYEAIGAIATELDVNFIVGGKTEIQQRLIEQMKGGIVDRYPAILLFTPIPQARNEAGGMEKAVINDVEIVFVADTKRNYSTPERITNVYTPVLWPLYNGFIDELAVSKNIHLADNDVTSYVDLFYYSASLAKEQNTLAAALDAISIKLNLIINIKNC
jgi:hypothetical protein